MAEYYLKHGQGYLCPVCGTIYGRNDKIVARRCCGDKKPLSEQAVRLAEQALHDIQRKAAQPPKAERQARRIIERSLDPQAGIRHKDKWGHYSRKKTLDTTVNYFQAQGSLDALFARTTNLKALTGFSSLELKRMFNPRRQSALQCMGYAFHNHDWDSLRLAVDEYAREYAYKHMKFFVRQLVEQLWETSDKDIEKLEEKESANVSTDADSGHRSNQAGGLEAPELLVSDLIAQGPHERRRPGKTYWDKGRSATG